MALLDNPIQLIAVLFFMSLLPLFAVMGTSFLKLSIVLSMLRNALGIQQIPPNMAIYGFSANSDNVYDGACWFSYSR